MAKAVYIHRAHATASEQIDSFNIKVTVVGGEIDTHMAMQTSDSFGQAVRRFFADRIVSAEQGPSLSDLFEAAPRPQTDNIPSSSANNFSPNPTLGKSGERPPAKEKYYGAIGVHNRTDVIDEGILDEPVPKREHLSALGFREQKRVKYKEHTEYEEPLPRVLIFVGLGAVVVASMVISILLTREKLGLQSNAGLHTNLSQQDATRPVVKSDLNQPIRPFEVASTAALRPPVSRDPQVSEARNKEEAPQTKAGSAIRDEKLSKDSLLAPKASGTSGPATPASLGPGAIQEQPKAFADGGPVVQIGAFPSELAAQGNWLRANAVMGAALEGKASRIEPIKSGAGVMYRSLVLGFKSRAEGQKFCSTLKDFKLDCFVRP